MSESSLVPPEVRGDLMVAIGQIDPDPHLRRSSMTWYLSRPGVSLGNVDTRRGKEHVSCQPSEQHALGDDWIDRGRVFTAESEAKLYPECISASFARLAHAAGLPHIPLHGLRHTYASLAMAKCGNMAIVPRLLRHATVAFTLDVCSHALPKPMPRRRSPSLRLLDARAQSEPTRAAQACWVNHWRG